MTLGRDLNPSEISACFLWFKGKCRVYWRANAHLRFQGSKRINTLKWNCFLWWLICHRQLWECKTSVQCTVFGSVLSIFGSFKTDIVAECASWFKPSKVLRPPSFILDISIRALKYISGSGCSSWSCDTKLHGTWHANVCCPVIASRSKY